MASLFDTLQAQAFRAGVTARTRDSSKWFEKKVQDMRMPSRQKLLKDTALDRTTRNIAGNMYMYFYDPKLKAELPYYDRFPLTIMVEPAKGGFYGLNLHYLPLPLRAKALDILLGEDAKLPQKYIAPMIHRYLFKQVKSRFALVDKPEWEIATFLPTADFRGATKNKVYRDSRSKM